MSFLCELGGLRDLHRGIVHDDLFGVCRLHEQACGDTAFQHFARERAQDDGVFGSAGLLAPETCAAAEAG